MSGSGALGWTLAWRYLRRRRVAWLALCAVVLTVTIAYVPGPVMDGFIKLLKQNLRDTVADVQVDLLGLPTPAEDPAIRGAIDAYLRAMPEVTAVARRADGLIAVATQDNVKPLFGANLNGIEPEGESQVTPYRRFLDPATCDPLQPFALSEALFLQQARWHKGVAHVTQHELPPDEVFALLVEWGKLENVTPADPEWPEFVEAERPRAQKLLADRLVARLNHDRREAKLDAIWQGPDPAGWTVAAARAALQTRWDDAVQRHRDADSIPADQPVPPPAVLVGRELIKQWPMLRPGGTIELWTGSVNRQTQETSQSNRTFVITGVFASNFYDFDSRWIYADLRAAKNFLRGAKLAETWACTTTTAEAAPRVAAWLERRADDPATLRAMLPVMDDGFRPQVHTKDWSYGKQTLLRAVEVQKWMLFFIMALGILIAGLGIMVTLTVLVAEKSRDIGILASLGTTRGQLMQVFVGTGVLIGLIGSILGLIGGSILLANADSVVRGAAALGYDDLKVYVEGVQHLPSIPVSFSPFTAIVTVIGMLLSAFVFSLIPAWRAARLDPVKAIRRN